MIHFFEQDFLDIFETWITGTSLGIQSQGLHFSFTQKFSGSKYQSLEILLNKLVISVKIFGFHNYKTKKSTGSTEPVEPVQTKPLDCKLWSKFMN